MAGFRPGDAWFGLVFGREKWRMMGGGVRRWLSWAEGITCPFLSPATGGGRRWPVAPERERGGQGVSGSL